MKILIQNPNGTFENKEIEVMAGNGYLLKETGRLFLNINHTNDSNKFHELYWHAEFNYPLQDDEDEIIVTIGLIAGDDNTFRICHDEKGYKLFFEDISELRPLIIKTISRFNEYYFMENKVLLNNSNNLTIIK